jgi:hypothetical protein
MFKAFDTKFLNYIWMHQMGVITIKSPTMCGHPYKITKGAQ